MEESNNFISKCLKRPEDAATAKLTTELKA